MHTSKCNIKTCEEGKNSMFTLRWVSYCTELGRKASIPSNRGPDITRLDGSTAIPAQTRMMRSWRFTGTLKLHYDNPHHPCILLTNACAQAQLQFKVC